MICSSSPSADDLHLVLQLDVRARREHQQLCARAPRGGLRRDDLRLARLSGDDDRGRAGDEGGDGAAQRVGPGAGARPSKGYIVGGMLPAAAADGVEVALGQAKQAGVRLCRARQLLIARLV